MLAHGDRVGKYEVLSLLGAGGMGEVYRARDTELGREVALKKLPEGSHPEPQRLARLEHEARVLAALNHPGIATLYGIERVEGGPALLIMELISGPPLSELVPRPLGEAIEIAREIAVALEAAHARGVLHCDLKPSNVRLTPEGRVKLLDFGVARLLGEDADTLEVERSTGEGGIIGTAPYMSPEQMEGRELDRRSDVWSFGCVLYELLAGHRPFAGSSVAQVAAAVLSREPTWDDLPQGTPASVKRLLERCLRKNPQQRLQDMGDARLELEEGRAPGRREGQLGLEGVRPYPGLGFFREEDAPRFFGREAEVERLWRRLEHRTLLAVIGPSGAGKTSFVRAGIVASRPPGWATVVTTPGTSPLLALGQSLAPSLAHDVDALPRLLSFENVAVAYDLVVRWRKQHRHALVVVDHFEELFTQCPPSARTDFASLLGRLSAEGDVHVLLSLRDDFLMSCQELPPLLPVFDSLIPLAPLDEGGLRRAIVGPAEQLGVQLEDEALVDEMLQAVRGERAALPLLAFAMSRLWETRDRTTGRIAREAYRRLGGVSGALAHHAEATLGRIGMEHEELVRDIFRSLVTAQGTRVEVEREVLLGVFPDQSAAAAVLDRLVDARLLTAYDRDDAFGESAAHRVEIVHESLLQAWPRLVRWRAQDADALVFRDQLRLAAQVWNARGRPGDLLWSGTSYREFVLWRERFAGRLTALERAFEEAMVARERRSRRHWRLLVGGLLAASVVVVTFVGVSWQLERKARRLAEASRLVALGRLELEVEPTAALAYARRSLQMHDTAEARRLALEALWRGPVARVLPLPPGETCTSLAATHDGRWLACGTWGPDAEPGHISTRPVQIRGPVPGARSNALPPGAEGTAFVWLADGRRVEGSAPRSLVPWLGEDGALLVRHAAASGWRVVPPAERVPSELTLPTTAREGNVRDLDLDARRVLYSQGRSLWWRPLGAGPSRGGLVGRHRSAVRHAAFHAPTGAVISVDESREIRLWPSSSSDVQIRQGFDTGISSVPRLDSTGTRLAWHSVAERAVVVWDLTGPPEAAPLLLRRRSLEGNLGETLFLGDGQWLASILDGAVAFWPIGLPWPRVLRGHAAAIVAIAFTPDSQRLVSCANDGARVWPLNPRAGAARVITYERPYTCYGIAPDAEGKRALVAATGSAGFVAALDGREEATTLVSVPPTESIRSAALDPDGRWAAVAAVSSIRVSDRRLHLVDRETREVREFALPGAIGEAPASGGVYALRFVGGDRLLSVGDGGLLSWSLETGRIETLDSSGCGTMDTSADGRRVVVGCLKAAPEGGQAPSSEIFLLDLETSQRRPVSGHGDSVQAVAIDPSGELIATGDTSGVVRVGRWDQEAPHLLLGARGVVSSVDLSPDGRWVAATSGTDIWLWPMPDLTRPPLQVLPHGELLAKLDGLTNLRLVEDPTAKRGYRMDTAVFPGWASVPSW